MFSSFSFSLFMFLTPVPPSCPPPTHESYRRYVCNWKASLEISQDSELSFSLREQLNSLERRDFVEWIEKGQITACIRASCHILAGDSCRFSASHKALNPGISCLQNAPDHKIIWWVLKADYLLFLFRKLGAARTHCAFRDAFMTF